MSSKKIGQTIVRGIFKFNTKTTVICCYCKKQFKYHGSNCASALSYHLRSKHPFATSELLASCPAKPIDNDKANQPSPRLKRKEGAVASAASSSLNDLRVSNPTVPTMDRIKTEEPVSEIGHETDSMMLESTVDEEGESVHQNLVTTVCHRKKKLVKRRKTLDAGDSRMTNLMSCASQLLKDIEQLAALTAPPPPHEIPDPRHPRDIDYLAEADYLCAMSIYNTLRYIPSGREKDVGRLKLQQDAMNLKHSLM